MSQSTLTGLGPLLRLALRRDRITLPIWIVVLALLGTATYGSYDAVFPSAADREALMSSLATSPALKVLYGPAFDLSNAGGFVAWRIGGFMALLTGVMAMLTVVRHTRAEEDSGRAELVRAGVVGRHGLLAAAVCVAIGASVVAGILQALALISAGAPAAGSLALGASCAACGAVFAAVAAVTAQLGSFSRTANGISFAVLGVAFMLRAVGDTSTGAAWVSWLSPLAWAQEVRAFVENRWWVLLLSLITAGVLLFVAVALADRRDIGMGLLVPRDGSPTAHRSLGSPLALAWRLQRGSLVGWLVAFVLMGLILGSLTGSLSGLLSGNKVATDIFTRLGGSHALEQAFIAAMLGVLGLGAAAYGVQAVLRARTEETEGRAEAVLAAAVSRWSWLGGHLLCAVVGSGVLVLVGAAAVGATAALTGSVAFSQTFASSLVQLPAVWVVTGVSALLVGLLPRLSVLSWVVAGIVLVISLWGPILNLPDSVLDISPFQHVPHLPGGTLTAIPLVVLSILAVALFGASAVGIRRRDIG
ncbi:MAG TPA: ABC transporter permease [Candidatus Nanopelagicales bacterium]